jgi:hypothetical protein
MKISKMGTAVFHRSYFRSLSPTALIVGVAMSLCLGIAICMLPRWSFAMVLSIVLLSCALVLTVWNSTLSMRMMVFFSLLAVCEFVKKATFLVSGQHSWSQYLIFILPSLYYAFLILLPFVRSKALSDLSRVQKIILAYIGVALLNTWVSPFGNFQANFAATILLIMPWSMFLVAFYAPKSVYPVARTLVWWGVLSALYGCWQLLFGPTIVELNWAENAGELSIGASHLVDFLGVGMLGISVWRITGMQADAFTFAMYLMTACSAAFLLKTSGKMETRKFLLISTILIVALTFSLVRTVWFSFLTAAAFTLFGRRRPVLLRPSVLFVSMIALFFIGDMMATFLYNHIFGTYPVSANPLVVRALSTGTLEARMGSVGTFLSILPERALHGLGYASNSWIGGKFGSAVDLRSMVNNHNVFVELMWYVGLPGLLLFLYILYEISKLIAQSLKEDYRTNHNSGSVISAYLIGMLVTGLGNGGVFLSYYFFFFSGALAGMCHENRNKIGAS